MPDWSHRLIIGPSAGRRTRPAHRSGLCAARLAGVPPADSDARYAVGFAPADPPDPAWAAVLADAVDEAGYPDGDLTGRLRVGGLVAAQAVTDVCALEAGRLAAVLAARPVRCAVTY